MFGWMVAAVRLLSRMVGTVVVATFAVFFALENSIRGGFRTVILPPGADESSPSSREIIEAFNLDGNLFERYGHWVLGVLGGDFGRSTKGGQPVIDVLTHRITISGQLTLVGILLTVTIGVPLGLAAAVRSERGRGGLLSLFLGLSQSIPVFLTPIFLIWLFALELQWLPAVGWTRISDSLTGNLRGLVLPVTALVFAEVGVVGRVIRADVLRVLREDYVTAAFAKGMSTRYVVFRHALRPASLGLLNVIGANIGSLLSGAVIIEIIFGIGGLGQVLLEASLNRDLYLVLGLTTYMVVVYVLLNTIVDLTMLSLDPRLRRS